MAKPKWPLAGLIFFILCVIGACLVVSWLFGIKYDFDSSEPPTAGHSAWSAWVVAQQFVAERLEAPATADFPYYDDTAIEHVGAGRYLVASYVDSENALGVMVRTNYYAEVLWVGRDEWRLESLVFDE